jgi:hypothetical protein
MFIFKGRKTQKGEILMKIRIAQINQVLVNIQKARRGINIGKKELMSAVARGCYCGQMPKNEMAIVINLLIHEGYIEVLNDRIYICFDYVGTDAVFGFYVHWDADYEFQTRNIRAFVESKKEVK